MRLSLPGVPSPPAPEGWDKDLTAIQPTLTYSPNTFVLSTTLGYFYSLVFLVLRGHVISLSSIDDVVMSLCSWDLGVSRPSPRPRRVGIKASG